MQEGRTDELIYNHQKITIMSVTINKEIEKAQVLAAGLKSHLDEVGKHGITADGGIGRDIFGDDCCSGLRCMTGSLNSIMCPRVP